MKHWGMSVALAAFALAVTGAAESQSPTPPASTPSASQTQDEPPGEGLVCFYAIISGMAETGARCRPGQDVEFQTELARSVDRIEQFIMANSHSTREELNQFKKVQGFAGRPDSAICKGDILRMYDDMHKLGTIHLREAVDKGVSRPGTPTWGTCF